MVFGKLDQTIPLEHAKRSADEAGGPSELMLLEDGDHGCASVAFIAIGRPTGWPPRSRWTRCADRSPLLLVRVPCRQTERKAVVATCRLHVDGEERDATSGASFEVEDPENGRPSFSVADTTEKEVASAAEAARAAFADGRWSRLRPRERARVLN